MIEEVGISTANKFLEQGLIGAILVASWVVFALVIRWLVKEWKAERDAHNVTRVSQVEDIRNFARLGETFREQMKAVETRIDALLDVSRRHR
jgi:hypothetical protein